MARVNIYLPDDLAAEARSADINLSALVQDAVRALLTSRSTDAWLAAVPRSEDPGPSHDGVLAALDAVREEPPTRHG